MTKRHQAPRIPPLTEEQWSDEQRQLLEPAFEEAKYFNVLGTLSQHWPAATKLLIWANHSVSDDITITAADRELLILRIVFLTQCEYEWGQHVVFARAAGLSDSEIEGVKFGADAGGWSKQQRGLLKAADELHFQQRIQEDTWEMLCEFYDTKQLMDIVFAAGQYTLMSMAMNSFGTHLDEEIRVESRLKL